MRMNEHPARGGFYHKNCKQQHSESTGRNSCSCGMKVSRKMKKSVAYASRQNLLYRALSHCAVSQMTVERAGCKVSILTGYSIKSTIWPLLSLSIFLTTSESHNCIVQISLLRAETDDRDGHYTHHHSNSLAKFVCINDWRVFLTRKIGTRSYTYKKYNNTINNKYYLLWCLLKMRHAVFTTYGLCCTQTSMPLVYFNKVTLSLIA